MDNYSPDAFSNRDEPIPLIPASQPDISEDEGQLHKGDVKNSVKKALGRKHDNRPSLQDKLLEKLLQQVIPDEDMSSNQDHNHLSSGVERPSFNITTMSANFRRFNSRIGVVFVFQNKILRLLSWRQWTHTLSFLAIYTFVCLDPYLLSVLPLIGVLLALLVPSFITRHPEAPNTISSSSYQYSPNGPPIAPAPTVKPVKELSKDFFRNMRDLQNCMEDFSRVHDQLIAALTPSTNFSNELLSSTLFLFCFATASFMFIASHLMPWRLIFLVIGWAIAALGNPIIQQQMLTVKEEHVVPHEQQAKSWLDSWIANDIILDSAPETREVEIFELQHLSTADEWEDWLFSSSPYDPLSEVRLSVARPKGTRFFEDVQPPRGWEWSEKKWALDLWSREWVEERIITGVEVETEGERWVYDIKYGKEQSPYIEMPTTKGTETKIQSMPSWEEGSDVDTGSGRRGEWRRRRWVRMVKRRSHSTQPS
ncbi:integral peroxisomal membrane peroxin-domain-containing protein [Calycina marina]|uniref:Integral peroxisomal membrane peroxin-domain-containing protein n=1 Tax=Calycina marina TaxID=1763456 RepID=A0A9P7Z0J0_9HELO|nr:integral peroxisomal membrane peroxin-domain-containing protein [Calycina marina]